jgi:hypothetical protein
MSLANVVFYIAILGFVVYRRIQGRPVATVKQLLVLPVVLTVIGFEDLTQKSIGAVDVTFAVIGCAVSLLLGAYRGTANRISVRDDVPWVQWGARSVAIFAINIVVKLVLDIICVLAGGTTSGATSSLLLAAGLMLVGEAAVVWLRIQAGPYPHTVGSSSGRDGRG